MATLKNLTAALLPLYILVLLQAAAAATSDDDQFTKAKQECAPQLAGLAPCLAYVGGDAKTPTMDCCTGLKQVLGTSKKCVCLLVKYKDEPGLGVKFDVNRALGLPSICNSPAKLTECPSLLHLSPNSTEAKMFENYDKGGTANATAAAPSATATPSSNSTATNEGSHMSFSGNAAFYGVSLLLALVFLL